MIPARKLSLNLLHKLSPVIFLKRDKVKNLTKQKYEPYETADLNCEHIGKHPKSVAWVSFLQRQTLTWAEIKDWLHWKKMGQMKMDQSFVLARHETLGPDLAIAQFITVRGGKVKFCGSDEWLTKDAIRTGQIPSKYVPDIFVEGVDASETNFCYEGFENLVSLFYIKELILKNCPHIDDYALSRLYLVQRSLEKLDISGCNNVTERGLCTLHVLRKLRKLIIHDMPNVSHKELTCLMLQDILVNCEVEGVDYNDPALLRRLKKYL